MGGLCRPLWVEHNQDASGRVNEAANDIRNAVIALLGALGVLIGLAQATTGGSAD